MDIKMLKKKMLISTCCLPDVSRWRRCGDLALWMGGVLQALRQTQSHGGGQAAGKETSWNRSGGERWHLQLDQIVSLHDWLSWHI